MSPTRTWVCCSRLVACFMSELQIPSCLNAQKLLNSKDLSSRISIMNCHTTIADHPCTSLIQCYSIWCQWNHLVILWKSPVGLLVASTLVVSFAPSSRQQNDCLNLASWGSTVPSFHLQLWQRRIRKSDVLHEVWPYGNVLDEVW